MPPLSNDKEELPTVVLDRCVKCSLEWVNKGEQYCPRCRTHNNVPKGPVIVSGKRVWVNAVVLHGSDMGLRDKDVRKGLDILNLFERCRHSYVSWRICPVCYKTKGLE